MLKRLLLPVVLLALLSALIPVKADQVIKAHVDHLRVQSNEHDFPTRDVYVWTPTIASSSVNQLPIVYFLHGWPGGPQSMMSAVIPALMKSFVGGERPFIAVFPDGNAKTHSDSEWADSSDGRAMVESWLTKRVIPNVERKNIRTRSQRAIVGFSMGGYGAAMIALHHPDLFSQVGSLAGYFILDDITGAFRTADARKAQSPANYLQIANQINWYLAEGTNDFTIPIRGQAVTWNRSLKAVGAKVTLDQPSNYHDLTFVAHEIPELVNWLSWSSSTPTPTETDSTTASA